MRYIYGMPLRLTLHHEIAMTIYEKSQKLCENNRGTSTSGHMNFCNLTSTMVVRRNNKGWMFVSMVNKDYPALYFEEMLVTRYALVAKKSLAKCEIRSTNHTTVLWVYNN